MTDSSSPLAAAGVLATPVLHFSDTPESRNCLLIGPVRTASAPGWDLPAFVRTGNEFDTPLPVRQEAGLAFLKGGLASADPSLRPRAVAVAGPGCTLMGIARTVLRKINTAASAASGGPLTELELARGLLAYNKEFLGYTGPPVVPMRPLPNWMAGMYLTIPLEFDETAQAWITSFPRIRTWAGTMTVADDTALGDDARPLTLPDATAVTTQMSAALAAHPDITKLAVADDIPAGSGPGLRRQLLSNPFDAVFRIIEVLRQLRTAGPGSSAARRADVVAMIVALCETVTIQVLQPVAQSTAGNAVLRQFQIALEDTALVTLANPDAAKLQRTRTVLAGALGLVPSGTTWAPIREQGPSVRPQEMPLARSQEVVKRGGQSCLIANVLGYPLEISQAATPHGGGAPSWSKLSLRGTIPATTWLAAHATDADIDRAIGPVAPAAPHDVSRPRFPTLVIEQEKVRARAQIAARIAGAEGGMDSVQAGDNGLISYGMQQWAAHGEDELTVLFERFRAIAPDQYDLFFGSAGLQTKRWIGTMKPVTNSAHVNDPPANDIDDANPYGPDPATLGDPFDPDPVIQQKLMDYFPFYATFVEVPPGQPAENIPAGKFGTALGRRYAFLMKDARFRLWCGRARLAGLMSHPYRRAQIQQAAFRFTRIEHESSARRFSAVLSAPFPVPAAAVTSLKSALTAAGTNMKVGSRSVFPGSGSFLAICERELIACTPLKDGSFSIQRGQHGTVAATHAVGTDVSRATDFAALSGAIDNIVTALAVKPGGFYYPGSEGIRLVCEQELMYCTARTRTTLTVQRGYEGTAAAAHADGTVLYRIEGDTFLAGAITATGTSITVNDGSFLPAAGDVLLRCGSEIMRCTAAAGNTLTVVRGQENTTSAAHGAGAIVYRIVGYAELFNSELTAASVLDIHINEPDIVIPAVYAAIRRTPGDTHAADGTLAEAWLRRFGVNYLAARAFQPRGAPWMNAGTRNNSIIVLHDKRPATIGALEPGLSPDPGTFTAWKRSTP